VIGGAVTEETPDVKVGVPVRIRWSLRQELREIARVRDRSISYLVEKAIEEYVARNREDRRAGGDS
jgi:predicted transcriptional regulator